MRGGDDQLPLGDEAAPRADLESRQFAGPRGAGAGDDRGRAEGKRRSRRAILKYECAEFLIKRGVRAANPCHGGAAKAGLGVAAGKGGGWPPYTLRSRKVKVATVWDWLRPPHPAQLHIEMHDTVDNWRCLA